MVRLADDRTVGSKARIGSEFRCHFTREMRDAGVCSSMRKKTSISINTKYTAPSTLGTQLDQSRVLQSAVGSVDPTDGIGRWLETEKS